MPKNVDTFIASDIHLGSAVSRSDVLLETLKKYNFKRLVLLGDIFDDLNFKRLKTKHWKLLSHIHELANEQTDVEVIWITGNHDELITNVMSHILGIPILGEYEWEYNGKKYLAMHGHQFDSFMIKNKILSKMAASFYKFLQRIDRKKHRFTRSIKRLSKAWLRVSEEVASKVLRHGKERGVDYIFCGHTHQALFRQEKDINYFNTGCWTDIPSTFVTIDDGGVLINENR